MNNLLPSSSSQLERYLAECLAAIQDVPVDIAKLWNPDTCPVEFLPYLAWAFSVDRWDPDWSETKKRAVINAAYFVHQHKGTIGALRRVVEPFGFLLNVIEWWQNGAEPGTFKLEIGVLDTGITDAMYEELERLISDAKPLSRHLTGLSIKAQVDGKYYMGAATMSGSITTVYPYVAEDLDSTALAYMAASGPVIADAVSVYPQ